MTSTYPPNSFRSMVKDLRTGNRVWFDARWLTVDTVCVERDGRHFILFEDDTLTGPYDRLDWVSVARDGREA